MKNQEQESNHTGVIIRQHLGVIAMIAACCACIGCRATPAQKSKGEFFTSGSREADQRASQKMAQAEQLSGEGEGAGEKGVKKANARKPAEQQQKSAENGADPDNTNKAVRAERKVALFERLGGMPGVSNIVDDFMLRALNDPRVNWNREGVKRGGWLSKRDQSAVWKDTPENVAKLKQHLVEFIALATGGPPHYTGNEIQATHAGMHITNPEFDAVIGDLKASLDKLQVPNLEQKELLAIVESTRPQIVTVR